MSLKLVALFMGNTNLDEEDGPPVASGLFLSSFEIPAAGVALALAAPRYFRSFLKYFSKALRKNEMKIEH